MISNSYYRDHTNIFLGDEHENTIAELRLVNHILNENFTLSDLRRYYPKLFLKYNRNKYPKFSKNSHYVVLVKYDHNSNSPLNGLCSDIYYIPYDLELLILKETFHDPSTDYNQIISLEYDNIENILKQSQEIPKEISCDNYHIYGSKVIYIEGKMYKRFVMPDDYSMDMKKMNYPKIFIEYKCYLFINNSKIDHSIVEPTYKSFDPKVFSYNNELYDYIDSPHYEDY